MPYLAHGTRIGAEGDAADGDVGCVGVAVATIGVSITSIEPPFT
jgi:hypothetical protein